MMGEGSSSETCAPYVGFYMLIDDAYCVFYYVSSSVVFCAAWHWVLTISVHCCYPLTLSVTSFFCLVCFTLSSTWFGGRVAGALFPVQYIQRPIEHTPQSLSTLFSVFKNQNKKIVLGWLWSLSSWWSSFQLFVTHSVPCLCKILCFLFLLPSFTFLFPLSSNCPTPTCTCHLVLRWSLALYTCWHCSPFLWVSWYTPLLPPLPLSCLPFPLLVMRHVSNTHTSPALSLGLLYTLLP